MVFLDYALGASFDCDTTYYADVKGLTLRCKAFPSYDSKHLACFKDLWWKYLVLSFWGQTPSEDASPFNILDSDVCRKNCRCMLEINFADFRCMTRGRPPAWTTDAPEQHRSAAFCRSLALPEEVNQSRDEIIVAAGFAAFPLVKDDDTIALLDHLLEALNTIGIEGLEILSWPFLSLAAISQPPLTVFDKFFDPGIFQDLVSLAIGGTLILNVVPTKFTVSWSTINIVMANMTENIRFFTLRDLNITAIPKPSFSKKLLALTCIRCLNLVEAPVWLAESKLQFLHISHTPISFPLKDLPPLTSLSHLSFCETPVKKLPDGFLISKLYPNLENLDLNSLDLTVIPQNLLEGLPKLRRLDLGGNNLVPLPSFEYAKKLQMLLLDGIPSTHGSLDNTPSALLSPVFNFTRVTKRLILKQSDLANLNELEILSVSFYQSLEVDENAFKNLSRLKFFAMNGIRNLTRLPNSLKYTCNLKKVSMSTCQYGGQQNFADPDSWLVPIFIPKFYKNMNYFDIMYTNIPILPPSLLALDAPSEGPLVQRIYYGLTLAPVWSNSCETYKFAKRFKMESVVGTSILNATERCQTEYVEEMRLAMSAMENARDVCLRSKANIRNGRAIFTFVLLVLAHVVK